MEKLKGTDVHFPLSAMNLGMMAYGALEGKPNVMAFNGGLFVLNSGLAVGGRKDEVKEEVEEIPEMAKGSIYDKVLRDSVKAEALEVSGEKKGGRRRRRLGGGISGSAGRRQVQG